MYNYAHARLPLSLVTSPPPTTNASSITDTICPGMPGAWFSFCSCISPACFSSVCLFVCWFVCLLVGWLVGWLDWLLVSCARLMRPSPRHACAGMRPSCSSVESSRHVGEFLHLEHGFFFGYRLYIAVPQRRPCVLHNQSNMLGTHKPRAYPSHQTLFSHLC